MATVNINNEDIVEAIRDDGQLVDEIADALVMKMQEAIMETVREAFDYHQDHFRVSWMRMMEAELADLTSNTRGTSCEHGRKVFDGIDHVIRLYLTSYTESVRETLGIDNLPQTIQEVAAAAVDGRIDQAWNGNMGGITIMPSIKATIGAPVPAFSDSSDQS